MSYATVYAKQHSRAGVLESIRSRRTYGAADNIILDVQLGDAFMCGEI